ncbi:nematode resistance protein-like HSPRO2 [Aristolochia californica]|uniref:nematode resistance protein-like HSPRO2 n=1 Tax=Aristolochia californica TaxID=171875 RepID=UPI0035E13C16
MVDLDWKAKMITPKSPKLSDKSRYPVPPSARVGDYLPASTAATLAYEQYVRLPELSKLWSGRDFPDWKSGSLIRPALQGLEITFRFVSLVLSDTRPYANQHEWKRRLEALALHQIELIGTICEEESSDVETRGDMPIADLSNTNGVLARDRSMSQVWNAPNGTSVVNRTSEASLLPRLASWHKSEDIAAKIAFAIECQMQRSPFTLGIGEPNLSGKPNLEYDLICRPADLHALKKCPSDLKNLENQTLFTTYQILECWVYAARKVLDRVEERIEKREYEKSAKDCWLLERIWKLLVEIEDLHLLMDPDDFLRLKNQLAIKASESGSASFCFRSKALLDLTGSSKDLRHKVPQVLGVEVDPTGGPRVQEAAMNLFHRRSDFSKLHLLQAFQAIEGAVKRFFFGYRELVVISMGSLEAKESINGTAYAEPSDQLSQIFLEPPYFPSLDAAKTFLGEYWQYQQLAGLNGNGSRDRSRN